MNVNPNIDKPIFIQIAEQLEDSIFTGVFPEETQIPSTNEISALLSINPHTVLKGMNVELSLKLTGFLKYDLFEKADCSEDPLITITYHLKDGTSLTLSEKDQKWLGIAETFKFK